MAAFLVHGRQSCVDGRDDCGCVTSRSYSSVTCSLDNRVIGTPGGDMGEFVTAMSVAEQLMDRKLSYDEIDLLLRRRLD